MSDTRNVKLGVTKVFYDGADLGYTKGGVEVTVSTETHKVEVDQFGKTPINEIIMGRTSMAKVPLAESTLENLVSIMPGATLVDDAGAKKVMVESAIGTDLLAIAKPLILRPVSKADTDRSEDFTLLIAATAGALQFAYKLDEERIYNVEFNGYPSAATRRIFVVGDMMASALTATFDEATDIFTTAAHSFVTGQGVMFDATTFPTLTGETMAYGKVFYVGVLSATTFAIFPTAEDALANTGKILGTTAGTALKVIGL